MPFHAAAWTRHRKGLSHDGHIVCLQCGIELPNGLPVQQIVCTKEDRLYIGDIPSAVDCR